MSKIHGSNLILGGVKDGTFAALAYAKSCEIEQQRETREVSSPTSGKWREYLAGRCDRSIRCECLLSDSAEELEQAFRSGEPMMLSCRQRDNSGYEYRGEAIITSLKIIGRIHEMASFSVTMRGTGEWEYGKLTNI